MRGPGPANLLLRALEPAAYDAVRPHLRLVSLTSGATLCDPGDPVEAVIFPESGLISIVTPMASGQSVDVNSCGRDGAFGHVEAVGSGVATCRVTVQMAGEALTLAASVYARVHEQQPGLQRLMSRRLELLLAEGRQSVGCLAFHSVNQRLARLLLECEDHTGQPNFTVTQEYVGSMIGAGRPRVNQAVRKFQSAGYVRYTRGRIEILDRRALLTQACECYTVLRGTADFLMRDVALTGTLKQPSATTDKLQSLADAFRLRRDR